MRFFVAVQSQFSFTASIKNNLAAILSGRLIEEPDWDDEVRWSEFTHGPITTTILTSSPTGENPVFENQDEAFFGVVDNGTLTNVRNSMKFRNGRLYLSDEAYGNFVVCRYDKSSGQILAFSSRPAPMPVFYFKNKEITVISSDAMIVASFAEQLCGHTIRLSEEYVREYLSWSYPYTYLTPFEDVFFVPTGHYILAKDSEPLNIREISRFNSFDFSDASVQEKGNSLAESLVGSVGRIPAEITANLRLSGGKDSRVLLAALTSSGRDFVAETRGRHSDLEASIAGELARSTGTKHILSSVNMAEPGSLYQSVVGSIRRMAGHLSAEPQQIMFEGAHPQFVGQYLLMGHSHIQRGGFARTMRNQEDSAVVAMQNQCSPFVSEELKSRSDNVVLSWYSLQKFPDFIEPLYELHVQKRASTYLLPQYRDYSNVARLHYPLISHDFVAKCDALSIFDRVSEQVIFSAAFCLNPHLLELPLCDDLWRFDRNGKGAIVPESFETRTSEFSVPDDGVEVSGGSYYNARAFVNLAEALKYIRESSAFLLIWNSVTEEVRRLFTCKDLDILLDEIRVKDRHRFDILHRFIWRMYAVAVWSEREWLNPLFSG